MEFITTNAIYIFLALTSGLALLWPMLSQGGSDVPRVSPTEAVLLMNRSRLLVLDVRDVAEYAQGHIQGAKNIPLNELEARLKEIDKYKSKPVLVFCQRGVRSNSACKLLAKNEFTQLQQLDGGLDKWVEAKMPLAKA